MTSVNLFGLCAVLPQMAVLDLSFTQATDTTLVAQLNQFEALLGVETPINNVEPLRNLRHLRQTSLSGCKSLTSIAALEDMKALGSVDVSETHISTLSPLATCRNLKEVNVPGCRGSTTLASLAGAPPLEVIQAEGSGITNITGLTACPRLVVLDSGGTSLQKSSFDRRER